MTVLPLVVETKQLLKYNLTIIILEYLVFFLLLYTVSLVTNLEGNVLFNGYIL